MRWGRSRIDGRGSFRDLWVPFNVVCQADTPAICN